MEHLTIIAREHKVRPNRKKAIPRLILLPVTALMWMSVAANSAPSGLNIIPTIDVYDPGVHSIEFQSEGTGRILGSDCDRFALAQMGAARGIEVGIDKCLSVESEAPLFNAKIRLRRGDGRWPALAAGIQNVGRGEKPQPYLVTGFGLDQPIRGHLGAIVLGRVVQPMAGIDCTWRSLTLQADWLSGKEGAAGAGLSWAILPSVTATYSLVFPNSGEGAKEHVLNFQYLLQRR